MLFKRIPPTTITLKNSVTYKILIYHKIATSLRLHQHRTRPEYFKTVICLNYQLTLELVSFDCYK